MFQKHDDEFEKSNASNANHSFKQLNGKNIRQANFVYKLFGKSFQIKCPYNEKWIQKQLHVVPVYPRSLRA